VLTLLFYVWQSSESYVSIDARKFFLKNEFTGGQFHQLLFLFVTQLFSLRVLLLRPKRMSWEH
jgi:hypothetical protein